MDKEQIAIARLQDAARLSLHRFKKPLQVTYSGGKDSQVLLALAERAGIDWMSAGWRKNDAKGVRAMAEIQETLH